MKKFLQISSFLLVVVLMSGCGLGGNKSASEGGSVVGGGLFSQNRVCVSEYEEGGKVTVYTDGERMRSEVEGMGLGFDGSENYSDEGAMYMIADNEWVYTWDPETKEGMKFAVDMSAVDTEEYEQDQEITEEAFKEETELEDMQGKFTYSCKKWKVDEAMFTPPEDVNFQDFADLFNF